MNAISSKSHNERNKNKRHVLLILGYRLLHTWLHMVVQFSARSHEAWNKRSLFIFPYASMTKKSVLFHLIVWIESIETNSRMLEDDDTTNNETDFCSYLNDILRLSWCKQRTMSDDIVNKPNTSWRLHCMIFLTLGTSKLIWIAGRIVIRCLMYRPVFPASFQRLTSSKTIVEFYSVAQTPRSLPILIPIWWYVDFSFSGVCDEGPAHPTILH